MIHVYIYIYIFFFKSPEYDSCIYIYTYTRIIFWALENISTRFNVGGVYLYPFRALWLGHGGLSVVSVVCYQVEVCASG